LNLKVRQTKPLPPLPTTHQPQPQIHSQVQVQSQPQPQPKLNFKAIPIKNLPITEMNKQIESFKNATEREGSAVTNLLVEKLNYHLSQEKNSGKKSEEISAQICKTFAKYGQRAAGYKYNPTQEIKEELVKFALAWLTMKIEKKDVTLTSWDDAIDNMAMSVFNKSKEWGMEF
jgi:hemerythrin